MAQKQLKQQTKKEYRSMTAFKKHFFPNAYQKELAEERSRDPKTFGTGLAKNLMEGVRRELRKRNSGT